MRLAFFWSGRSAFFDGGAHGTRTAFVRHHHSGGHMNTRSCVVVSLLIAGASLVAVGCGANKDVARTEPATVQTTASANAAPKVAGNVGISEDLATACKLDFSQIDRAPKFDFDQSDLSSADRAVLQQVATCVTTGPLKGRGLRLVGRADHRGEVEYNMALGEHRAGGARAYLAQLGVAGGKMVETSRGKLDATGTTEDAMRRDRRVDLSLQ
jgi:peptidoglycan-associated lipoprotein